MLIVDRKQLNKLFSWGRYLYWADIQRKKFIDYNADNRRNKRDQDRYQLSGKTIGGRTLKIIFQLKRNNVVRIITGWPV
jgi:uncharacterized DUF497 family protein